MIEAGSNALKGIALGIYYREQLTDVYLAMHAARSNQEATPDAELVDALRPFAMIAPGVEDTPLRDGEVVHRQQVGSAYLELTKEDFRRAAEAFALAKPVQEATPMSDRPEITERAQVAMARLLLSATSVDRDVREEADDAVKDLIDFVESPACQEATPDGPLVEFFRNEGFRAYGHKGDYELWTPEQTAVHFLREHLSCVQEATRTVGDAELTSELVEKIERRMVALEAFTGSTGRYADRHGKWTVKSFIAELRALSHTSSSGGPSA